jgi:pimeloyl-ACP methyl ester carboxylesterase
VPRIVIAVLAAALLPIAAASQSNPPSSRSAQSALVPAPCPAGEWEPEDTPLKPRADARRYSGSYTGGLYRIEVPEKWTGELVLWAHGLVAATGRDGRKLRAPEHPLRDHLIPNGFAWASSSYRCNGYVAGAGMLDTLDLIDLFPKVTQGLKPSRIYFTGASMGGHATLLTMHLQPERLSGALAMCHASMDLWPFFTNLARTAATLAGITPTQATLEDDTKRLVAAMGSPPDYTDAGRKSANQQIESSGGPRPFAAEGLADRSQFVANLRLGLPMLLPPPDMPHFDQQPFSGRIDKPVMTIHTTGDMLVPVHLQRTLRQAVTAAGRDRFLVQRIVRAPGHCTFSAEEATSAFDDLVSWVRNGKRPDGDDVMADFRDAGRRFTNPLRPGDPGELTVRSPEPNR